MWKRLDFYSVAFPASNMAAKQLPIRVAEWLGKYRSQQVGERALKHSACIPDIQPCLITRSKQHNESFV
jgi:hypothetical protein